MSTKIKFYTMLASMLIISSMSSAQGTLEMVLGNFVGSPPLGPTTSPIGAVSLKRDPSNDNHFFTATGFQATSATVSLANQTYTGLGYSNISTGLVFGASPTTAVSSTLPFIQQVDPLDTYNLLGSFNLSPGGPTNNMFTSDFNPATTGTGIIADGFFSPPANDANGAVSVFTAAQVLFDQPGGPATHNTATRYYYGDVVITFNRYVANPVIQIAGLGGSYRYVPAGGNPAIPGDWLSTYFTTELEFVTGYTISKLSGNSFLTVTNATKSITNNAVIPNGASANTGGLFNDIGAATGSISIAGTLKTLTIKVYLRGSNASQFPWSATAATVPGSNRAPFTGDIWWIAASMPLPSQSTLPATGVHLDAVLNGNDVSLSWVSQSEINSDHFEIERSTDAVSFSQIASKQAAGYSVSPINYAYTDPAISAPVYYYRLKLVDVDGRSAYSNITVVRKPGAVKTVRVFPNPVTDNVNLEFSNANGNYDISLYNQSGQMVVTKNVTIASTVQTVNLEKGSLPPGSYIISAKNTATNEKYVQNVIFQ